MRRLHQPGLLTLEQEIELSQRVESGELSMALALLGSSIAREAMAKLADDLRGGNLRARDLLRNPNEGDLSPDLLTYPAHEMSG